MSVGGNTTSGGVLEAIALPALKKGGYTWKTQEKLAPRPHGGEHNVDLVATKGDRSVLISKKWQQSSGTTDEKVPYEVISLVHAITASRGRFQRAYLVLGGDGFRKKLLEWYVGNGLAPFIVGTEVVEILTLNQFIAKANKGVL